MNSPVVRRCKRILGLGQSVKRPIKVPVKLVSIAAIAALIIIIPAGLGGTDAVQDVNRESPLGPLSLWQTALWAQSFESPSSEPPFSESPSSESPSFPSQQPSSSWTRPASPEAEALDQQAIAAFQSGDFATAAATWREA
ncbi:MAG: hypothetical protein AAF728_13205, partial [Cyanobacteria bacterium P01_D01_bin.128]